MCYKNIPLYCIYIYIYEKEVFSYKPHINKQILLLNRRKMTDVFLIKFVKTIYVCQNVLRLCAKTKMSISN